MALIKCPECKKKISDQCENCPNCGYPTNKLYETSGNQATDIENVDEAAAKNKKSFEIKSLLKKWGFWVAVGVVILAIVITTIFLLNRDTKPKVDKDGNLVFVELTNEVYTNAKEYKGYNLNIKGKVFQVMSDNGIVKGIQIWLDPDTCEQNLMIYYNTEEAVKQGDYIICTGYIDSVTEYKNAYGATLYAPLVYSSDLIKATYKDVMAPAKESITLDNLKVEDQGYSFSVETIEFAETETRVYVSAKNNGKATLYIDTHSAVIVQGGKQYNTTTNYEADYDEVPYEIAKGASVSGVIVFPAMSYTDLELLVDIHSGDYEEKLGEYTFLIGKSRLEVKEPIILIEEIELKNIKQEKYGYTVSIEKVELYKRETRLYLTVKNSGKSTLSVGIDNSVITQDEKKYNFLASYDADKKELPKEIAKNTSVSGVIVFPAINLTGFEFTIDVTSNESEEKLGKISVSISGEKTEVTTAWPKDYPSAVGSYFFEEAGVKQYLTIKADGTLSLKYVSDDPEFYNMPVKGTWTQNKNIITYSLWFEDGMAWNNPWKGKVYKNGIDFIDGYYKRR